MEQQVLNQYELVETSGSRISDGFAQLLNAGVQLGTAYFTGRNNQSGTRAENATAPTGAPVVTVTAPPQPLLDQTTKRYLLIGGAVVAGLGVLYLILRKS